MNNRVFLAACPDYELQNVAAAVRRIFDGFGGIDSFNISGRKVLIKTNLLAGYAPERAVTTHPAVIEALCREFLAAGAKVTIADSPGGLFNVSALTKIYQITGMTTAAANSGAELNFDTGYKRVKINGKQVKDVNIISVVLDADFIVSAAKLKTHGLAYYTGAVKNLFGVVPGLDKPAMHSTLAQKREFNDMLVDLCEFVKPGFSFVDGVWGMEGAGPSGGTPKFAGVIGGALNPYALDLAMCDVAVLPHTQVLMLAEAAERGLCPQTPQGVEHIGDAVSKFRTAFTPAIISAKTSMFSDFLWSLVLPKKVAKKLNDRRTPYPIIQQNCIGCAKCAESCPRSVITIENRKAVVDFDGCIRCYCCHEMCPVQAIELEKRR